MGYSITVPCQSPKAKDELLSFFKEHYRPWHKVAVEGQVLPGNCVRPNYDPTSFIHDESSLAYDRGTSKVGFNYSTGNIVSDYMLGVLRWASLRVGRKTSFKKYGLSTVAPYIVYDGCEAWPVLEKANWEQGCPEMSLQWLVDGDGFRPSDRMWEPWKDQPDLSQDPFLTWETELQERDKLIKTELARLSEAWDRR